MTSTRFPPFHPSPLSTSVILVGARALSFQNSHPHRPCQLASHQIRITLPIPLLRSSDLPGNPRSSPPPRTLQRTLVPIPRTLQRTLALPKQRLMSPATSQDRRRDTQPLKHDSPDRWDDKPPGRGQTGTRQPAPTSRTSPLLSSVVMAHPTNEDRARRRRTLCCLVKWFWGEVVESVKFTISGRGLDREK